MSYIKDLMTNIADLIDALHLYSPVVYGSDPPDGGICLIQGSGFVSEKHLDTGILYRLPILINAKNQSQETALDALAAIHAALVKTNAYESLSTSSAQVVNITTTAGPTVIGREQNSQWICGSSVEVSFYWR